MAKFQKGHIKTGGKKKGTPNKTTKIVREIFTDAFHAMQNDPKVNLLNWGKDNPTEFYRLTSKLIPEQHALTDKDGNDVTHTVIIKKGD